MATPTIVATGKLPFKVMAIATTTVAVVVEIARVRTGNLACFGGLGTSWGRTGGRHLSSTIATEVVY